MMFFTALGNSGLKKVVGTFVVLALMVSLVPAPSSAQAIDPAAVCEANNGEWDGTTCNGLAEHIICIVFSQLNLPLPEVCGGGGEEEPTDYCSTVVGVQDEEDPCPSQEELDCTNGGGTWNSETEICTPAGNGGGNEGEEGNGGGSDNGGGSTTSGGGLTGGGGGSGGQVLGVSTDDVCSTPLITSYLRFGKQNDFAQMVLLQVFLRKELGSSLLINGVFDVDTKAAVDQFQVKYAGEVLLPWVPFGLLSSSTPTSYVYKTTKRMINKIHCASLDIPMPQLP